MGHKKIYTLGTGLRSLEDFAEIINCYNIETVIDVRSFPSSKLDYFKQSNLAFFLKKEGIEYSYMGKELGGYRKGGYENYIHTNEFKEGLNAMETIASAKMSVVICAERFPWKCHRQFIAQALHKRSWKIEHIIDKGRTWTPR